MLRFFPKHVVDWMTKTARETEKPFDGYTPMPPIGDLPVIVATRMSLAFPFLLSAVPLHAIDYTLPKAEQTPKPVWFSDGGISSNFPIAMFDAPIPSWPTLAINLGNFTKRTPPDGIVMALTADAGRLEPFTPVSGLAGFFSAILGTMQNWNDNVQAKLPGFRDRIAMVALRDNEGGLNLDMEAATLQDLQARGIAAGKALVCRFEDPSVLLPKPPDLTWESHRWTRLRTTLGALKEYLARFSSVYRSPVAPDVLNRDLITSNDPTTAPRVTYPLRNVPAVREAVAKLTDEIDALGALIAMDAEVEKDRPKPTPSLVMRPNLDR